jgi:hypothetical protein
VKPYTNASGINALINHPSIRERTLLGLEDQLDVSPLIDSGQALFFGDEKGGFLVVSLGEQIWEVHTQFLPETSKRGILALAHEAQRHMFCETDCIMLKTFVDYANKPALWLALRAGFRKLGESEVLGKKGDVLIFTVKDWARSLCQQQP